MGSAYISAVAFYGHKTAEFRGFLAGVQDLIAAHVGGAFRPYSLEQIHATLIAFNAVPDPVTGAIVNEYYLENAGLSREMDLPRAMSILTTRLQTPLRVRIGGYGPHQEAPFLSRGRHLSERAFSVQGDAFVLMGWPSEALAGRGRPLDGLRREMNAAHVLHRYHRSDTDVDDDFYLVVGHHEGAPAGALEQAAGAVRAALAAAPIDVAVGTAQVSIVAADSHTLVPAKFVGSVPVDEATLRALMT